MPIKGDAKKVLKSMKEQYGDEKGEDVFYATANKQGRKPETWKKEAQEMTTEQALQERIKRLREFKKKNPREAWNRMRQHAGSRPEGAPEPSSPRATEMPSAYDKARKDVYDPTPAAVKAQRRQAELDAQPRLKPLQPSQPPLQDAKPYKNWQRFNPKAPAPNQDVMGKMPLPSYKTAAAESPVAKKDKPSRKDKKEFGPPNFATWNKSTDPDSSIKRVKSRTAPLGGSNISKKKPASKELKKPASKELKKPASKELKKTSMFHKVAMGWGPGGLAGTPEKGYNDWSAAPGMADDAVKPVIDETPDAAPAPKASPAWYDPRQWWKSTPSEYKWGLGGAGAGVALGLLYYLLNRDKKKSFLGGVGVPAVLGGLGGWGAYQGLQALGGQGE